MVAARQDSAVRRHAGTHRAEREERVSQGLLLAPELCRAGSTVTLPGIAHLSSGHQLERGGVAMLGRARPPAATRVAWGEGGTEGWWHGGDGGTPRLQAGWPQEPVRAPLGADPGFTCRDHSCTERVGARPALPCLSLYSKGQERPGAGWECHLPSREAAPSATCPQGPSLPPRCPPSRALRSRQNWPRWHRRARRGRATEHCHPPAGEGPSSCPAHGETRRGRALAKHPERHQRGPGPP